MQSSYADEYQLEFQNQFQHSVFFTSHTMSESQPSYSTTWTISPISNPKLQWAEIRHNVPHRCCHCHIDLLTGERPGFCCGPQGRFRHQIPLLPPLPSEYDVFIHNPTISSNSRILNLIFSFASLETTHEFPNVHGPPGFFAIQGQVYHCIRPSHPGSAIKWLLYDGFMQHMAPHPQWVNTLPPAWIDALRDALLRHNSFVRNLIHLSQIDP